MGEALELFFQSGEFWPVLIKVLLTASLTGLVGLCTTLIGKIVAKSKDSKIMKQAEIAVKAAEQKFPNEGKKMGPEKMAYVMDYLAIIFPKIKNNQYLYNIAEAAVYELNRQRQEEDDRKAFEEKYGELPSEVNKEKTSLKEVKQEEPKVETPHQSSNTQRLNIF